MKSEIREPMSGNGERSEQVVEAYYRNAGVRARILEGLGANGAGGEPTAMFITASDRSENALSRPVPMRELDACLDQGKEIARSLWDREYLVADLDVEYANFDFPADPHLDRGRTFRLQRPVVDSLRELLLGSGIRAMDVIGGRGHHFIWQVRLDSRAGEEIAELGRISEPLRSKYEHCSGPGGERMAPAQARAFAGLGLVLEYLGHQVLQRTAGACEIPVMITGVEARAPGGCREIVTLDLTEYADPLHTRAVRIPYSVYYKPLQQAWAFGPDDSRQPPLSFKIPLGSLEEARAIEIMGDSRAVMHLAQSEPARIPEEPEGTARLVAAYRSSPLAEFHRRFYEEEHDPPESWPHTYDRIDPEILPPSARIILDHPNDLLLKPSCARHLVRVLLALGWHPRHIAGLIRSKYERDFGWGAEWYIYDAAARADFYARLFAGLIVTGLDDLSDFGPPPVGVLLGISGDESEQIGPLKRSLQRRLAYDRLAGRPFHGLFL